MSERKKEFYDSLIGKRQGKLVIVGIDHEEKRVGKIWECKCDCGRTILIPTSRLSYHKTQCCAECNRRRSAEQLTKHGLRNKNRRLHAIWKEIVSRCSYQGDTGYKYYGAMGLSIADEWKEYPAFYEWSMSHGYRDDLSIDRIDNSKGYSPENCRWETDKVQGVNHSNSILVTIMGTTMCLNDWARAAGVWRQTVYQWRKAGIMEEKIRKRLPHGYTGRTVPIKGQQVTLYEEAV